MPTHAEKRILEHSPENMFDLVIDVAKYPEFLPWCQGARIRKKVGSLIIADLIIGFKGIRERFTSRVTGDRSQLRIDVSYEDGPFKYLNNHWIFYPTDSGECEVDFYVDFEFRSVILQKMMGLVFEEAVKRMVAAFVTRADQLYGKTS